MEYIDDIYQTVQFVNKFLAGAISYEDMKNRIMDYDESEYTMEITNDEDDFFDFYCGNLGFTIYQNDDGSARFCENASYYIFDNDGDQIDTIDIEL